MNEFFSAGVVRFANHNDEDDLDMHGKVGIQTFETEMSLVANPIDGGETQVFQGQRHTQTSPLIARAPLLQPFLSGTSSNVATLTDSGKNALFAAFQRGRSDSRIDNAFAIAVPPPPALPGNDYHPPVSGLPYGADTPYVQASDLPLSPYVSGARYCSSSTCSAGSTRA